MIFQKISRSNWSCRKTVFFTFLAGGFSSKLQIIMVLSHTDYVLKYENLSNAWCLLHFESWKRKIGIFHHFSLILCYFLCENCLKTWIWALWTTLVNACWPHACDMTENILGTCKYLSQIPYSQIQCPEMQNSSWGVEKNIFFSLQPVDGMTTFIWTFEIFQAIHAFINISFDVWLPCKP